MTRTAASTRTPDPLPRRTIPRGSKPAATVAAIMYTRVSSRDQEKEGFSIPAQQKLLRSYAEEHGFTIKEEFSDIETAKKAGRTSFSKMIAWLHANPTCRTVLVEKTDRLYRNLKDWVELDGMELDIHLVKEAIVLSETSRSGEKFIHGIKVLMAKNYIDNLSEEVKKGLLEKAEQGIWPGPAPFGYINVGRADGKRIIDIDPERGPYAKRLFHLYATGRHTLNSLVKDANQQGIVSWKTKRPLHVSAIHLMLRNPLYKGEYEWLGNWYEGSHPRLVTPELWAQVQETLSGRSTCHAAPQRHEFSFNGLVHCGVCAAEGDRKMLIGELKKGKYVYYHCDGCKRLGRAAMYVREEKLNTMFIAALRELAIDPVVIEWVKTGLKDAHEDEKRFHAEAVAKLQKQQATLKRRLDVLYEDRLDGRITVDDFQERSNKWREELAHLRDEVARHDRADASHVEQGIALLELAGNAVGLYESRDPAKRRHLLEFLCSNSEFRGDKIAVTWRSPFDGLAQSIIEAEAEKARTPAISDGGSRWRSGRDSNPRPPA